MLDSQMSRKKKKGGHRRTIIGLVILVVFLIIVFGRGGFGGEAVLINEVMTSNRATVSDEDGDFPDWIELYNSGSSAVNLEGFWLSDDPAVAEKWAFPEVIMEPGDYLVVFASGKDRAPSEGGLHTNFRLSRQGTDVLLTAPDERMIDNVRIGPMYSNISYGRRPNRLGDWVYFFEATPGERNSDQGQRSINIGQAEEYPIYINEFITENLTSIYDTDGDLFEWVELFHSGEEPINLKGYWLSDDPENPFKWRFPDITVKPEEYLVVFASGKARSVPDKNNLHTSFGLNDRDDILVFTTPDAKIIEEVTIPSMIDDVSYGLVPGSREEWLYYPTPTPGRENTTQGFEPGELSGKELEASALLSINEVMAMNTNTVQDENGDYEDWIEIYNAGENAVDMAGFGLSDRPESPFRWVFPKVSIEPDDYLLVFASGKDRRDPAKNLHTNFRVSSKGETIVLTSPEAGRIDALHSGGQAPGLSVGRYPDGGAERFFFTNPTPGRANPSQRYNGYSQAPFVSHLGGRFDAPIEVSLINPDPAAQAVIRYTTNGKMPDENSTVYTGPIRVSETVVLRSRVFEKGKLPSPSVDQTYLINEPTKLAILSVIMDPKDLLDPAAGIYVKGYGASSEFPYRGANFWRDWEKPMHFQMFDENGTLGYSANAGIKIGGQYSRAMDQKIFNIFARNRYGSNMMEYPFFPGKDLTTFKALTVRQSGQDAVLSRLRDTMQTSLLEETDLDYQHYRPVVLFINGQYWGHYNLRERINKYYIAYNHDVDPEKVDMIQANRTVRAGSSQDYLAMRDYIANHDMRSSAHYEYVKTKMDVQNYMDYWIAQIYFANTDSANIRFWKERDNPNSRWRWIVYDTDWGFFNVNHNTLDHVTHPDGTGVGRNLSTVIMVNLLKNSEFRNEFIDRMAFHLNNTFTTERVIERINEMEKAIEDEMPRQTKRWPAGGDMNSWRRQVQRLRNFAENRNRILMGHIQGKFGLSDREMEMFDDWPVR